MDDKQKQKILNRYVSAPIRKKQNNQNQSQWVRDDDEIIKKQLTESEDEQSQEQVVKRQRIQSSDEQENVKARKQQQKKRQEKQNKKDKKIKKRLRKALGIGKDQEFDQFLSNLQIEGIDKNQILEYLNSNKGSIVKTEGILNKQTSTNKAKNVKLQVKQQNKYKMFEQSESSDMQIPEEARTKTIYRNKDGTIRENSQKEEKEKKKQKIMQKLAEWQRGMKRQKSEDEQQDPKNKKVWDDPMKRWQQKNPIKLLVCRYEGPPNRYNIKPGFRWDGVVRGNGFENRYLQQINLKKLKKDQQHMEYMKDL